MHECVMILCFQISCCVSYLIILKSDILKDECNFM